MPLVALASLVLLGAYGCGNPSIPPTGNAGPPEPSTPLASATAGDIVAILVPTSSATVDPATQATESSPGDAGQSCSVPSDELDAAFVTDLGLPAGAQVAPAMRYRETWRLRNSGGCTWPEGTALVFVSGDPIPGPQRAPVSQVGPGRDVDISVELIAPVQPARYASYWRLQAPGGQLFGAVVYAEIVVSSDAVAPVYIPDVAPRPSPTPWLIRPPVTYGAPVLPTPGSTPSRQAVPTADGPVPTATDELACGTLDPRFAPVVRQARALGIALPCSTSADDAGSAATTEPGTFQTFWQEIDQSNPPVRLRSFVIVREATETIYVLRGKDTATYQAEARAYEDTWKATQPELPAACAPLVPPPGHTMPTQSIGGLWCQQSLWNSIGWPVADAEEGTLVVQGDRNRLLVRLSNDTTGTYLLAIDLDARAATVYQTP